MALRNLKNLGSKRRQAVFSSVKFAKPDRDLRREMVIEMPVEGRSLGRLSHAQWLAPLCSTKGHAPAKLVASPLKFSSLLAANLGGSFGEKGAQTWSNIVDWDSPIVQLKCAKCSKLPKLAKPKRARPF